MERWTHFLEDSPLRVKITKVSAMLGVGQDFVVHHAKASVLARLTFLCLQHVPFLVDAFAAGFIALSASAAVSGTIEAHKTGKTISFPSHFEEARFAFVIRGVIWGVTTFAWGW